MTEKLFTGRLNYNQNKKTKTVDVVKTKVLISCVVMGQLILAFVFTFKIQVFSLCG